MFDAQPLILSLQVASAATPLAFGFGILAARAMSGRHFWGKSVCEAIFVLPLVLPPVVTGYTLLVVLGKNGIGGAALGKIGVSLLFTPVAAVLASAIVAFPLMYQSAKAALENVDPHLQDAARCLGASSQGAFWTISLPLARSGILAGIVLSFARSLGEFGATILVAGNIAGKTTTAPVAIYLAAEEGDMKLAGILCAVLAAANLAFILALNKWLRQRKNEVR